ncbi:hypothetical protein ACFOWE_30080 [Planomonospora corallina]|uniref:DUF2169 domain-containing protein n=1 Tax=Planomonospora corallina TaxID=1806052 RepID=A0ABV8IFB2_9ACTN
MAEVLRRFQETFRVEHGCFELGDPWLSLDGAWTHDGRLETQSSWVRVGCDVSYGGADVRMESWDAEPPPAGAPWVEAGEVAYLSGTGIVELSQEGNRSFDRLVLGPSHFLYGLRAHRVPSARDRDHEFWEDPRTEHVLLRFWPIRDVFDPVLHARPDSWEGRRPPPEPSPYRPSADWPTLRPRPAASPGGSGPAAGAADDPYRRRKDAERRVRLRIAGELNPGGAPTFSIPRRDLAAPWTAAPGLTGRVRQWQADPCGGSDDPIADRRDVSRGRAPVSAVVTVLDEEDDFLTVRDATAAEAARVIAAEQTWGRPGR